MEKNTGHRQVSGPNAVVIFMFQTALDHLRFGDMFLHVHDVLFNDGLVYAGTLMAFAQCLNLFCTSWC